MIRKLLKFANIQNDSFDNINKSIEYDDELYLWIQNSQIHIKDKESIKNLSALNLIDTNSNKFSIPIYRNINLKSDTISLTTTLNEDKNYTLNVDVIKHEKTELPIKYVNVNIDSGIYEYKNYIIDLEDSTNEYIFDINSKQILNDTTFNIKIINSNFDKQQKNILLKNNTDKKINFFFESKYILNSVHKINGEELNGCLITLDGNQFCKVKISEFGYYEIEEDSDIEYEQIEINELNKNDDLKNHFIVVAHDMFLDGEAIIKDLDIVMFYDENYETQSYYKNLNYDNAGMYYKMGDGNKLIKYIEFTKVPDRISINSKFININKINEKGDKFVLMLDAENYNVDEINKNILIEIFFDIEENTTTIKYPSPDDYCIFIESSLMVNYKNY